MLLLFNQVIKTTNELLAELDASRGLGKRSPPPLYHYTGPVGFLGILRDRNLRATDLLFMNDSEELAYGWGVVTEVARELHDQYTAPAQQRLLDDVCEWQARLPWRTYAVCFTSRRDALSQWRAYANDGAGYALRFQLRKGADVGVGGSTSAKAVLLKVLYDRKDQRRAIERVLTRFCEIADTDPKLSLESALHVLVSWVASFKSKAFEEEREWRMIVRESPKGDLEGASIDMGPSRFGITPFAKVVLGDGFDLVQIGNGPKLDRKLSEHATGIALRNGGYEGKTCIWHSRASYR